MANRRQRSYTEESIQENRGQSQETSLQQPPGGTDHQPDWLGRHLRGDRHLVEPRSPVAHQQLAELLKVRHGCLSPQGAPGLKQGGATTMGAILPPLLHLRKGDPTGVGLPLVAAVLAVNSIFGHGSERRLFLTLNGLMGLAEAMHHEAIGRIADQILAIADGIDGCLLYTSPSPRDKRQSRMPSSA